jgi:hypothetical protein
MDGDKGRTGSAISKLLIASRREFEMAETAPTPTEAQPAASPPLEGPRRFRPLLGGLTMMVLTVGGLVVLSPVAATAPPRSR